MESLCGKGENLRKEDNMDRFFSHRIFFQRIGMILLFIVFLFAMLQTQELLAQSLEEEAKREER